MKRIEKRRKRWSNTNSITERARFWVAIPSANYTYFRMLIKSLPENPLPSTFMCVAVFTLGASSPHHIMIASFYHCAKSIQVVFSKKKDTVATGLLTFVFQFFYENEIFRLFTVKKLARTHTRHIFSQSVPLPHCVCVCIRWKRHAKRAQLKRMNLFGIHIMIKCSNNLVQWQQIVIGYLHITNSVRCNHANGRERKTERERARKKETKRAHDMKWNHFWLDSVASLHLFWFLPENAVGIVCDIFVSI